MPVYYANFPKGNNTSIDFCLKDIFSIIALKLLLAAAVKTSGLLSVSNHVLSGPKGANTGSDVVETSAPFPSGAPLWPLHTRLVLAAMRWFLWASAVLPVKVKSLLSLLRYPCRWQGLDLSFRSPQTGQSSSQHTGHASTSDGRKTPT